jgi:hypothetical protein
VLGAGGASAGYLALKPRADQLQAAITADLQGGQRELEAGKASLIQANSKHDASLIAQSLVHFAAAKGQFLAAGQLADNSRLLRDLELIPGVGDLTRSRHAAVTGIVEMGAALSDAGQDLSTFDGQLIRPTAAGQPARNLLAVLDDAQPTLVKIRSDLQRGQVGASQVEVAVLPGGQQSTFLKARDAIGAGLASLEELDRLVPVLHEVLGGNGPRVYLVEQVNPAELRAGGGFIGTYTLLQADRGSLKAARRGNSYDLADPRPLPNEPGFIPQPGPYREIIPNISWSFVDSNEFPDFPANALAAETFVSPRVGKIDGVISIDYYAVAKMLELTGPLQVPGYALTVDSGNFIAQIIERDIAGDAQHKAILSALAEPMMTHLATLPPDLWPSLMTALNGLVIQRHMQAYFNKPSVEDEIDRVGWSGRLNPRNLGDSLMEVESNYGAGKTNYFLRRHYTLVLSRNGAVLHHRLNIDFTNDRPLDVGTFITYRATARLYVNPDARFTFNNLIPVVDAYPNPPGGTAVLTGWLPLVFCCGGQAEVVLEYDTPWVTGKQGMHQIYWQKQPGTVADRVDVTWDYGNGVKFSAAGDLRQDRIITLVSTGVSLSPAQPGLATLPSLGL